MFPIVGVGASAGGLEAFTQLLSALPPDTGMAFVLVQHLDPEHESALVQILARATSLPVHEVQNEELVQVDHIYVIPRDTSLSIVEGVLKLQPRARTRTPHRPIDAFFESLAQDRSERAVGLVLSGTATDGTLGLEAIKAEGGITFAQDDSAKYDGMPRSAAAAGCVDLVLSPADIAKELVRIAKHPFVAGQPLLRSMQKAETPAPAHEEAKGARGDSCYQKILLLLRNHSGVDFSFYKTTTIQRRITRRLVLNKQNTLEDYAAFLRGNAKELDALYSDVLISVTSFFRNPETFEVLQHQILPELFKHRGDDPLRCWVLGCSTGQEAYSIAIAFVEAAQKSLRPRTIQVFATDLNDALLNKARHGLYAKSVAEDISPERLRRFFVEEGGGYRISKTLREMVVFARQNLIADPPFSRLDLISCRNLLIYLEPSLQKKAMPTFHYALKPGGFLLLGASESIGGFTDLFEPVDKKHKIYAKKSALTPPFHLPVRKEHEEKSPGSRATPAVQPGRVELPDNAHCELNAQREADRITINQFAPPAVLVNEELHVLQFRGPTDAFLELPIGRPSFDVLKMARKGLMLPLRGAIQEAKKENQTARRENVRVDRNGKTLAVNLEVIPLKNLPERCFLIVFEETAKTGYAPKTVEPPEETVPLSAEQKASRIAELESEISELREYFQSMQEQHEAANEELQAANEEVQSANEELQSVNEELETSKEELESANEELTTVNEEMSNRNAELNLLNNDLTNLQASSKLAILLLGRDLTIRRFSPQAEKQFALLVADVGRPISHIRHGLVLGDATEDPLDLHGLSAEVIAEVREQEREVHEKKVDRWYSLRVRPYLTLDNKVDGAVLVLVDITERKRAEEAPARLAAIVTSSQDAIVSHDLQGIIQTWNEAATRIFGYTAEEAIGKPTTLLMPAHRVDEEPEVLERLRRGETIHPYETVHQRKDGRAMDLSLTVSPIRDAAGRIIGAAKIARDITDRKQSEEALQQSYKAMEAISLEARESEDRLRFTLEATQVGAWDWDLATDTSRRSPRHDQIFGYEEPLPEWGYETFLNKHVHPEDRAQVDKTFQQALAERKPWALECRIIRTDQAVRWIWVKGTIYLDLHGEPLRMSGLIMDITERKRLETDLRQQGTELSDADQRKNEFLAMLGHELRNPLSALSHGLDLLGKVPDDRARSEEIRGMMGRQTKRIVTLLDQLLDIARVISGKVALSNDRIELADVVRSGVETVRPLLETRKNKLTLSLPTESVVVIGDAVRLAQVVENLLTNAAKYADEGGEIDLTLEVSGDDARIIVRDKGIGVSADFMPHIFEVFAQAPRALDRAKGGLGLGLSLVRHLVEMHGGKVAATSLGLGHGTEFVVTLPRFVERISNQHTEGNGRHAALAEPGKIPPLRILVVDDEKDTAAALAEILAEDGNQTLAVHDGPAALAAIHTFDPEVVLLDLGLPEMDGYEVARRLRDEHGDKKILLVAVTGYQNDAARLKQAGFDQHLIKPSNLQKLSDLLAAWSNEGRATS